MNHTCWCQLVYPGAWKDPSVPYAMNITKIKPWFRDIKVNSCIEHCSQDNFASMELDTKRYGSLNVCIDI